ncbi:MAG TPA: DMT family transporter [Candidatus Saccharimonadales bacterium]|nr:DMT family transporter [Candidatus Saccharimonadales bacterium]
MSWQSLILIQAFLTALATIITRVLARDRKTANASMAITASWFILLYICGIAFLPWFGHVHSQSFFHYGWRFVLGGTAFALNNILTYKAFVYLDATIGSILGTIAALFTVIGAALILNEELSVTQAVGAMMLILAIIYGVLATRVKPSKKTHRTLIIGAIYVVAASAFYAVAAVNEKSLLSHVSVGDYIVFGWGWQTIMAVAAALLIQPRAFKLLLRPAVLRWTALLGILRAVSGLCFMLSQIRSNNVALVTVISNFRLIIVVILGFWLLKERQKITQKFIATGAATIALIIIFWK